MVDFNRRLTERMGLGTYALLNSTTWVTRKVLPPDPLERKNHFPLGDFWLHGMSIIL